MKTTLNRIINLDLSVCFCVYEIFIHHSLNVFMKNSNSEFSYHITRYCLLCCYLFPSWILCGVCLLLRLSVWRRGGGRRSRGGGSSCCRITSGQPWIRFTWVSSLSRRRIVLCCVFSLTPCCYWCSIRWQDLQRRASDPQLTCDYPKSFIGTRLLLAEKLSRLGINIRQGMNTSDLRFTFPSSLI